MSVENIKIKGAREHNLKNVNINIPRDKFVVITGLSGSGKSSLAFDTIYAEGQRRYVESLSSYARQFLGQMEKPDVDYIEGLSPAISIDQKTTSKNPRSTVGTVTEIYDYLRLLYARVGRPHCPKCGKEIQQQTVDQMSDKIMEYPEGTRFTVLSPVIRGKKGEHVKVFEDAKKAGYVRARADGTVYELSEEIKFEKTKKHNIEIVIDRLAIRTGIESRLRDSLETALDLSSGLVIISLTDGTEVTFSKNYACVECGISMPELSPRAFSFNNPYGACPSCTGLGFVMGVDSDLILKNRRLSINEGAITATGWNSVKDKNSMAYMYFSSLAERYGFTFDTPVCKMSEEAVNALLYGTEEELEYNYEHKRSSGKFYGKFEGVINNLERRYRESTSEWSKADIESVMSTSRCSVCGGARLKPEILAVTVGGMNIDNLCRLSINEAKDFVENLKLTQREEKIAHQIIKELKARMGFLVNVGLDYLTLARGAGSLSGGEAQRIRLATQIGSGLMGVLYILDEPSIGLHQRDNKKLLEALRGLQKLGNTLLVVEHDEETMYAADWIIDIGPGAGIHGGKVVAEGTVEDIKANPASITGQYLSGVKKIPVPEKRRKGNGHYLTVRNAQEHNLKNIDVKIPLGIITAVTGVSGSGKSSLITEILYKKLANELNGARMKPGKHGEIEGLEYLDKVIDIDQSPIGRTPRSNPATYTGVFTDIRNLFASTSEAKMKGYSASRFSFNVSGGRCEACSGDGIVKIEMHFLADIYVPCEVCKGKRYNRETLEVKYKGKNISDVLNMTVEEGVEFFSNQPKIRRKLETLNDVGLGYIKIGQSATTLSGGEAQRVKLSTELSRRATGKTVYILDEPTTGLHTADVHRLIDILQKIADGGNTVIVIEHNLDVIKTADYIIDLGPDGGYRGGEIVAEGTPEEVAKNKNSETGHFLKNML
ncbi:MAG: excinuclease ABC subunit UvrA [Bacillota bacterium]|nr:excinuclease ABC subunit UvrA [Bacillota bacterium]